MKIWITLIAIKDRTMPWYFMFLLCWRIGKIARKVNRRHIPYWPTLSRVTQRQFIITATLTPLIAYSTACRNRVVTRRKCVRQSAFVTWFYDVARRRCVIENPSRSVFGDLGRVVRQKLYRTARRDKRVRRWRENNRMQRIEREKVEGKRERETAKRERETWEKKVDGGRMYLPRALWASDFLGRQLSIESSVYWRLLVNVSRCTQCTERGLCIFFSRVFIFFSFFFTKLPRRWYSAV